MRDRMAHRGPDGGGIWALARSPLHARTPPAVDHRSVRRRGAADGELRRHGRRSPSTARSTTTPSCARELQALGKYEWKTDHSDTEVLLHAYEEWGVDCVKRFYGMFARRHLRRARSRRGRSLHLIRDRVGVKPMYFTRTRRRRVAVRVRDPRARRASRRHAGDGPHGVLALPDLHRRAGAADDVPRHLQAAGRPRADDRSPRRGDRDGSTGTARPDRAATLTERDISEPEAVAELTRLLKQSIARRMVSDVPFGVLLSGGVDSSMNVALMSELMDAAGHDVHDRLRRAKRTTTSFSSRGGSASATRPTITRR